MRILVPTDCSDLSAIALKPALLMAEKFNATILALKVINAPVDAVFNTEGELIEDEEFDTTQYKKDLKNGNAEILNWASTHHVKVEPLVRTGLMIDTILRVIENQDIDFVIMNSDRTTGLKKMVHGPIVERIVLNSKVPVLTVKEYFNSFEHIAFANNFRRLDIRMGFVQKLQEAFNSTLHLVRVNTPRKFMSDNEAIDNMKALVKKHNLSKVEFHIIKSKKINEGISDFCKIHEIDLMCIGSKQRTGLISVMRGCPSKEIVNEMEYPVLTFRSRMK